MFGIPIVLKEGTSRKKNAVSENISAIRAISEAIKTTFGPKGLSKMLVDSMGDVTVTSDGYKIMDDIEVEHPAAKLIVQLAKSMNKHVGDGVIKSIILTGELLKMSKELLEQKLHPNTIIKGFNKALKKAIEILDKESTEIDINNKEIIKQVAITALNSKPTFGAAEKLADISVNAILKIFEKRGDSNYVDIDLVQIIKKEGAQLKDSSLIEGLIVDKEVVNSTMPKLITNAKIALINHSLEITKTEFDTDIKITEPQQLVEFKEQEELMIKEMVNNIVKSGANVVFCQKGIDELAQHYLASHNIMAIRRIKRSDMEKMTKSTSARIISDIKTITPEDLGKAEHIEEKSIGKDKMIFVERCSNPKSISILIRGSTKHIVEEAERSFKNCLSIVKKVIEFPKIVPGAGAIEIELSKQIRNYSQTISTRESIAVESFADALESIPFCLADNSGIDTMETIADLRAKHEQKNGKNYGINLETRKSFDALKAGIIEPSILNEQALSSATELCMMLIRIDEIIAASKSSGG